MTMPSVLPLHGLRVLNPRPAAQAGALTAALQAAGADVLALPLLAIEQLPLDDHARACLLDLDQYQCTVFISANAARLGLDAVADFWPQWPYRLPAFAVGAATRDVLATAGLPVITPAREDSEGLLALPELQEVAGQRWLLFRGDEGRELLPDTLRARGAKVDVLPLYRRRLPDAAVTQWAAITAAAAPLPDVVLITSSRVWQHWRELAGRDALRPLLVAVSARVAAELTAAGASQVLSAGGAQPGAWIEALSRWRENGAHGIQ